MGKKHAKFVPMAEGSVARTEFHRHGAMASLVRVEAAVPDEEYGSGLGQAAVCVECGHRIDSVDASYFSVPTRYDVDAAAHRLMKQKAEIHASLGVLCDTWRQCTR